MCYWEVCESPGWGQQASLEGVGTFQSPLSEEMVWFEFPSCTVVPEEGACLFPCFLSPPERGRRQIQRQQTGSGSPVSVVSSLFLSLRIFLNFPLNSH